MSRFRRVLAPAGIALAVVLVAALSIRFLGRGTGEATPDAVGASPTPTVAETGRTLDEIPGFGITPESVFRDETIAYWEAYRRDVAVRECMGGHGFVWDVEATFPDESVIKIAGLLGAAAAPGSDTPTLAPEAQNAQRAAGLPGEQRDAYYLALYGETAADMEYLDRTGSYPPGSDGETFATGGCRGAAYATASIWDVPRHLTQTVEAFRTPDRSSADFLEADATYAKCLDDGGPPDASSLADSPDPDRRATAELLLRVEQDCRAIAEAANAAERQRLSAALRDSVRTVLEHQRDRYAGAIEQMRADSAFLDYLARTSARITAEMGG